MTKKVEYVLQYQSPVNMDYEVFEWRNFLSTPLVTDNGLQYIKKEKEKYKIHGTKLRIIKRTTTIEEEVIE